MKKITLALIFSAFSILLTKANPSTYTSNNIQISVNLLKAEVKYELDIFDDNANDDYYFNNYEFYIMYDDGSKRFNLHSLNGGTQEIDWPSQAEIKLFDYNTSYTYERIAMSQGLYKAKYKFQAVPLNVISGQFTVHFKGKWECEQHRNGLGWQNVHIQKSFTNNILPPTNLTATTNKCNEVDLSWNKNSAYNNLPSDISILYFVFADGLFIGYTDKTSYTHATIAQKEIKYTVKTLLVQDRFEYLLGSKSASLQKLTKSLYNNYLSTNPSYPIFHWVRNNTGSFNLFNPTHLPTIAEYPPVIESSVLSETSSNEAKGRILYLADKPSKPTVTPTSSGGCLGEMKVEWTYAKGQGDEPDEYEIEWKPDGGTWSRLNNASSKSITHNTNLVNTAVYYDIRAVKDCPNNNSKLQSDWSSFGTGSDPHKTDGPPIAPNKPSVNTNNSAGEITINWQQPSGKVTGYEVYRIEAGVPTKIKDINSKSTTTFTDVNPQTCTPYEYQVAALNSCTTKDGPKSVNSDEVLIGSDVSNTFDNSKKLTATDGEWGDRIDLRWSTNNRKNTRWNVFRINTATNDTVLAANLGGSQRTYTDFNASANTFYKYRIIGEADCNASVISSNPTEDLGFRLAYGLVNGQITYNGGIAAKDIKVVAKSVSGASGKSGGFLGPAKHARIKNNPSLQTSELTFITYFNYEWWNGNGPLVSKYDNSTKTGWKIFMGLRSNKISLTSGSQTIDAPLSRSVYTSNQWFSVATTIRTDSLFIYINGQLIKGESRNGNASPFNSTEDLILGSTSTGDYISALWDETRLYNRALSHKEIAQTYDVFVNPSSPGLVGYWRFDEGTGNTAYDYSKTGQVANRNHGTFNGGFSSNIPSANQMQAGAYTDSTGSYFIPFVPFQGSGDNFQIIPTFGTHRFSPSSRTVYIGGSSLNIANMNFIDESSFRFTGIVSYGDANSPCKVPDATVSVDGEPVFQSGVLVKSGTDGKFDIQVPIGFHTVSVSKQGHVFEKNGFFPDASSAWDFQADVSNATFIDTTKYKVIGRVAGGFEQKNTPLGFGKGKNNIGTARLIIESKNTCRVDTFYTDSTGEYVANLFPLNYTSPRVTIPSNPALNPAFAQFNQGIDLRQNIPTQFLVDSVYDLPKTDTNRRFIRADSVDYKIRRDFNYYSTPKLTVIGNRSNGEFGEDSIAFFFNKKFDTTLAANIALPYPVFRHRKKYAFTLKAEEMYSNKDDLNNIIYDTIPLQSGRFEISNQLAENKVTNIDISDLGDDYTGEITYNFIGGEANTATNMITPSYSFTRPIEINFRGANSTVKWEPNAGEGKPSNFFRGIVFGSRSLGGTFSTDGPQVVTMVLRDPPGSNSYSQWIENKSITSVESYVQGDGVSNNSYLNGIVGMQQSVGLGVSVETEISAGVTATLFVDRTVTNDNEIISTTTTSTSISTGKDIESVGESADLFFGRSMNMDFGIAEKVLLVDTVECGTSITECFGNDIVDNNTGKVYKLAIQKALSITPGGYGTEFLFTQLGIETSTIPKLELLRDNLLANDTNYVSYLTPSDPLYGSSNDDSLVILEGKKQNPNYLPENHLINSANDDNGYSYHFKGRKNIYRFKLNELGKSQGGLDSVYTGATNIPVGQTKPEISNASLRAFYDLEEVTAGKDEVWYYNQQIRLWKETLAENERDKVEAMQDPTRLKTNISYQGGTVLEKTSSTSLSETKSRTISWYVNEDLAFDIVGMTAGTGVQQGTSLALTQTRNSTNASTNNNEQSFKYVIEDAQPDDEYSIDVFESANGYGPSFSTRGGQTSCPIQEEVFTQYFEPGQHKLHIATLKMEDPEISISPKVLYNVPANSPAAFTLTLTNNGVDPDGVIYRLKVIEESNPDGAIIKIDGLDPARDFFVPQGQSINKLLTIEKGANAKVNYEGIKLVLHSVCQYAQGTAVYEDVFSIDSLSVFFLPSCTDISLQAPEDQFVANFSNNNVLPALLFDYDINYPGLESIKLEYKPTSVSRWEEVNTWYKTMDSTLRANNRDSIPLGQSYTSYQMDISSLIDQNYQLRASANCRIPGFQNLITETSPVIGGIFDRVNPHPFGTPSPADGVLDPNDDISITFNETIASGALTTANFEVRGQVNGRPFGHDKAIAFNGINEYLEIANGFSFAENDFTVEFWAKGKGTGKKQVILSQGANNSNAFELFFNANDQLELSIAGRTFATNQVALDTANWFHYAITFDRSATDLTIMVSKPNSIETFNDNNYLPNYTGNGKTYIGKSAQNSSNFFEGSMHEMRIWSSPLDLAIVSSRINNTLSGREANLIGYWPMDEARGAITQDKARGRNAQVFAQWEINPKSSALALDGLDDYVMLDSAGTLAITPEMDMTIEFWFKTNGGATHSFFSNGSGRESSTDVNNFGWNIQMNNDNSISVKNNFVDFIAVTKDFADNKWHHFAFVLNRLANATAYIDGEQQNTMSSTFFNGFGAGKLAIGARYQLNGVIDVVDRHFKGNIDEVRVWNSARLVDEIKLNRYNRLRGDEFGLLAYYPFEKDTLISNVPKLISTFNDESIAQLHASAKNGAAITSSSPDITLQRQTRSLNYTFSVNNDKIIITPDETSAAIENVTLNVAVKDVKDLRGNVMQSPKSWIAYVNKNQVVWQNQEVSLTKELNDTMTFKATFANTGGEAKQFNIKNLPIWLSASPSSGTINPLSTRTVMFTVNPSANIGDYAEDVHLSTDFGFDEKLLVRLKVRKTPPNFAVDPSLYADKMSVIGQISINGVISANSDDKLIAIINNEVRGVANLNYVESYDRYMVFMDIYSNTIDSVKFQVWNSALGELHTDVTPEMTFSANTIKGSPNNPTIFNAINKISKPIYLKKGWNWVSFPLFDESMGNLTLLTSGLKFADRDIIKTTGFNKTATYAPSNGWTGELSIEGLNNATSYLVRIDTADTLEFKGFALDPDTVIVPVVQGWNRIGFVSLRNMHINTALGNYNAAEGDVISSQERFAYYDNRLGWIGSLQAMEPNKGYLLKSQNGGDFVYPRLGLLRQQAKIESQPLLEEVLPKKEVLNPADYEASTSIIAMTDVCDEVVATQNIVLAAYSNNQLRGWSEAATKVSDMGYRYFMNAFGNTRDVFEFALIDTITKERFDLSGSVSFYKNQLKGSPQAPVTLSLDTTIDCEKYRVVVPNTMTSATIDVFPNPFKANFTIKVNAAISDEASILLIDELGRIQQVRTLNGSDQITIGGVNESGAPLPAGIYFLKLINGQDVTVQKVIKL